METTDVKHSKADVRGKARATLEVRFKALNLISYSVSILLFVNDFVESIRFGWYGTMFCRYL